MHVSSQSCPKRMTTARSSSANMDWSTAHPECRCGKRYDMAGAETARGRKLGRRKPRGRRRGGGGRAEGVLEWNPNCQLRIKSMRVRTMPVLQSSESASLTLECRTYDPRVGVEISSLYMLPFCNYMLTKKTFLKFSGMKLYVFFTQQKKFIYFFE